MTTTTPVTEHLLGMVSPSVRVTVADAADDPLELLSEPAVSRAHGPVVVVPSEWICRQGPVMVGIGAEDDLSATLAFAESEAAARPTDIRLIHVGHDGPGRDASGMGFGN